MFETSSSRSKVGRLLRAAVMPVTPPPPDFRRLK